jgi:DNA mismatch endonuclease, patch repair protein
MDVHTPKQRSGNMAAIKGKHTKPEMIVRRMLHAQGYRYVLHRKQLPGRPDLVFPSRKKVIFVHGCFWHMHECRYGSVVPATRTEFWQTKRGGNVERDRRHQLNLIAQGWSVLVVWECETKRLDPLAERLRSFLGSE